MNFLHPWALAIGAAAISLPVLIHWLTKPRPMRVPLSTVRFVMEVVQQRRARYRLRDWIVLALRAAAVALLAWAFARPLTGVQPLVAAAGAPGDAARVVILDQSQSMAAVSGGASALDRGRPVAAKYLSFRPGLSGNLVLAAAQPRPTFAQLSVNFGAMRDELAAARVRSERLDLDAAITVAAELLASAPANVRRELVIVSDFQRSNWASADFRALPQDTLIQLESAAPKQTAGNVGLTRVAVSGRAEQGREVRIEVDVANHSPGPRDAIVEVSLGHDAAYRLSGICPPNVTTTLTADAVLKRPGWLAGEAVLNGPGNALAADDRRPFALLVRPLPSYALITREPSDPRPTSSHFLERALVPFRPRDGQSAAAAAERVFRVDPQRLDREALASASAIVLDHPGPLSDQAINLLAALLRRGRGVLYVAAEPQDATNLRKLSNAAGTDLRMPVELQPPPAGQRRRGLFLAEVRREQPPFAEFGDDLPAAIGPLRFDGGLTSRRLENGLADDVLATYSDRSACLVATACGAGTLAVLNVDLAESNLPGSPVFVPLVGELAGRLLSQRKGDESAASGEPLAAYLPADAGAAAGLTLAAAAAPSGGGVEDLGALTEADGFVLWRWPAAGPPGVYVVKRGSEPVFALASTIPPVESDLASIEPEVLQTRLAGGRRVQFASAAGGDREQKDDAWAWILVACTACMIVELATLKLFRS